MLGDIRLGRNVKVEAGSVVGIPARVVETDTRSHAELLDHAELIDPIMEKIHALEDEVRAAARAIEGRDPEPGG